MNAFLTPRLVKYFCIPILLLCALKGNSQTFFNQRISESELQVQETVNVTLRSNYSSIVYARERNFTPTSQFRMKLPDNSVITISNSKWQQYTNSSFSFIGKIAGQPNSSVVFSNFRNRWHGMVTNEENQKFIIQQTTDETYALSSVNEVSFHNQERTVDFDIATPANTTAHFNVCDAANPCTANPVPINIMVVYTPAAAVAFGSTAAITAAITTSISNMNIANSNSGVNAAVQFNLANCQEIGYVESGSISTDLSRLAGTADGFMDFVHTLRDLYEADLVSLVTASPTSTCGLGYVNTNPTNYSPANGFNVVIYNCVASNFTLSHELGHNMGLRHDRYMDATNTPCAHHHGYVNQAAFAVGAATNKRWRTILAYNDQCSEVGFFTCTRVNNWSNPAITRNGDPMGVPIGDPDAANEVYGINRFACVVASFRGLSVIPLNFINVNAAQSGSQLKVSWQTANESNMDKYEVEVATRLPQQFTSYASVMANNGSSNFYQSNLQLDTQEDLFIRVKAISTDGKIKYSSIVYIKNGTKNPDFAKLASNVVNNVLEISMNNSNTLNAGLQVLSFDGKVVYNGNARFPVGQNLHTLDVSALPNGYYVLRIFNGQEHNSLKFLKY